jgi:hypothetical protein
MYSMPAMPLTANVWYDHHNTVPTEPPDETLFVSLSPITPSQWIYTQSVAGAPYQPTHIIRTPTNGRLGGNTPPSDPTSVLRASLFECPPKSGHFYWTIDAHVCGAGFPNEHHRLYMVRVGGSDPTGGPGYIGWI